MLSNYVLAALMSSGSSAPVIPAVGNLVARWSASSLPTQATNPVSTDNANVVSWTDSISGYTASQATSATQPKFRTARLGGQPSVQFTGTQWMSGLMPGLKTLIDAGTYSLLIIFSNAATKSNASLFGNSVGGNSFTFQATGAVVGRYRGNNVQCQVPYSSTAWMAMGYTSSATAVYPGAQSGSSLERLYMHGMPVASNTSISPATSSADGAFGIGCINSVGNFPLNAEIHEILIWNKVMSSDEMLQAQQWACSFYNQPLPYAGAGYVLIFDGDSLTRGVSSGDSDSIAGSYPYQTAQALGLSYGQWSMQAVGGMTVTGMSSKIGDWSGIGTRTGKPIKIAAFEWFNEHTLSGATVASHMVSYASSARSIGKLCLGSSTGCSLDPSTSRNDYDTYLDANSASMCDSYVPIHTNSTIGIPTAYAAGSATYWNTDGTHLRAAGYNVLAPLMTAGISAM